MLPGRLRAITYSQNLDSRRRQNNIRNLQTSNQPYVPYIPLNNRHNRHNTMQYNNPSISLLSRRNTTEIQRPNITLSSQLVYNTPRFENIIDNVRITPLYLRYFQFDNYNNFSELQDVKIGLINNNILKYTKVECNKNDDSLCVICQDDLKIEDIVRRISCNHIFHIECIDEWFIENKKCPICKFILE